MRHHFLELIRRAATVLPADVTAALRSAAKREAPGSAAKAALSDVLRNCELAASSSRPLCQDTGTNLWQVYLPQSFSQVKVKSEILAATKAATKKAYLRPNAVDPVTGQNTGDNTGIGAPVVHFHEWTRKAVVADLLLKGGGSENVSALYALPHQGLGAGRDLEGVRKVVLDAVFNAQGKGCGPAVIGVGIGGDRATSMLEAKEQLFRLLNDKNADPTLAKLERKLLKQCNALEIGPMGFGGATTVLGVKIGKRHRLPASYFVAVAYLCWAARRASVTITGKGASFSEESEIAKTQIQPKKGRR